MEYTGGPPSTGSSSNSGFLPWNSPFGDTTYTKIFVGGLAWETQNDALRRFFEQFGEILEAVVIVDKHTGRSKGYGFVTFEDPESAKRACVEPNPVIDGRLANCNLASLGRPQPTVTYAYLGPNSITGGLTAARGAFVGNMGYQQPVSHGYPQAYVYPSYGYASYGTEYLPQGMHNPFAAQPYIQYYGAGTPNTGIYSYGSLAQTISGSQGIPGYMIPGLQFRQYGSYVSATSNSQIQTVGMTYQTGTLTGAGLRTAIRNVSY